MSQWRSDDDFETNMKAFSEIRVSTDEAPEEPPPPTITQYVARMRQNTKSIFDTDDIFKSTDDQKVTLVYSGRGKGCMTKIFVPGRPVPQAIDDEEGIIVRKIKEETGFIGHNALVESKYRKLCEDAKELQSMILKNGESPNSPTSPQPPLSMIMQHAKKKHKHEKLMPESDNAGPDFAPAKPMGGSFLEDQFKLNTSTLSPGGPDPLSVVITSIGSCCVSSEIEGEGSPTGGSTDIYVVDNDNSRERHIFYADSNVQVPPLGQ